MEKGKIIYYSNIDEVIEDINSFLKDDCSIEDISINEYSDIEKKRKSIRKKLHPDVHPEEFDKYSALFGEFEKFLDIAEDVNAGKRVLRTYRKKTINNSGKEKEEKEEKEENKKKTKTAEEKKAELEETVRGIILAIDKNEKGKIKFFLRQAIEDELKTSEMFKNLKEYFVKIGLKKDQFYMIGKLYVGILFELKDNPKRIIKEIKTLLNNVDDEKAIIDFIKYTSEPVAGKKNDELTNNFEILLLNLIYSQKIKDEGNIELTYSLINSERQKINLILVLKNRGKQNLLLRRLLLKTIEKKQYGIEFLKFSFTQPYVDFLSDKERIQLIQNAQLTADECVELMNNTLEFSDKDIKILLLRKIKKENRELASKIYESIRDEFIDEEGRKKFKVSKQLMSYDFEFRNLKGSQKTNPGKKGPFDYVKSEWNEFWGWGDDNSENNPEEPGN